MTEKRCASYYTASIDQESDYPAFKGLERVDIAIVGGGFTGINTALELAERGYKVAVLEANKVGWGASGRNGGQVTGSLSGEGAMLKKMRQSLGDEVTDFVWNMRWRGQQIIQQRTQKYAIQCDLKHGHLQAAYKPRHVAELKADLHALQAHGMGEKVQWLDAEDIPSVIGTKLYHGALRNDYNMHVHPLNLCLGEARAASKLGVNIYEHSKVLSIEHGDSPCVLTAEGRLQADMVVLAGNAYHQLERKTLAGQMFPAILNIITTEPLSAAQVAEVNPEDLAVYDTRMVLDYYRLTADKRLLFGGGTNYSGKDSKDITNELLPRLVHTFPQLEGIKVDFAWQGSAGIVINRIPMLGRVKGSKSVYYAQGYSGHGIATTHVVSEIMAKALSGTLNDFDVFTNVSHVRIPFGDRFGNNMMALGMWYYQLLEHVR